MVCCRKKYSSVVEDKSYYDYTPIEYVEGESIYISFSNNGDTLTYNGVTYTDEEVINLVNLVGKEIPWVISNDGDGTANAGSIYYGSLISDNRLLSFSGITAGSSYTYNLTIPNIAIKDDNIPIQIATGYGGVTEIYDNRSWHVWVLSDIITDTLIDSDFCDFFNRYYKNWFVNGCSDNLEDDLILCWLTHKDQITAYATAMATYNPIPGETVTKAYGLTHSTNNLSDVYAEAITNNDTTYGQRDSTDNEYDYPISGALSTSTPNKGLKSQSLEVTDENTVTRQAHTDSHNRTLESNAHTDTFTTVNNEKPNQIVKNIRDLTTYWLFMAEQFRDCFTLSCGMTW